MNVWAVTVGEPLPTDGPNVRLYRTGMLAGRLARRNHRVTWWTSQFDHAAKTHRTAGGEAVEVSPGLTIRWIPSPGYRKNVSLQRILDHRQAGAAFARRAEREPAPDVILCSLPTLDLSVAAADFGRRHGVPVVIDVRDWWPDEFATALPRLLKPFANIALAPFRAMAAHACGSAAAITGITEAFVDWGVKRAGRDRRPLDRAFPMGYSGELPSPAEMERGRRFWAELGVARDPSALTICYIGNFSSKVELPLVIAASRQASNGGVRVRLLLCGSGDTYEDLKRETAGMADVVLPGRVGRAELWAAMELSDAGIAPYLPTESFAATLSNKMIEYWAGGLPVITSLPHGTVVDLIREYHCGATYRYGDQSSLASVVTAIAADRPGLAAMRANSLKLFNDRFVAERIYEDMADYLEEIAHL